ncbi:MAG: flagellar motor protein MotB [Rhodobacter sp.]|nr:flagellar motor protein MotB [Rhodobacter sp.]
MSAKSNAPVIIKRKKVVAGDGHHGGAWKVAYADFVTAMMAFFMLMWLLNATTEKQRKGIADYFNPTIPINRISGGGEGSFGGTDIFSEETLAKNGTGASQKHPTADHEARGNTGTAAEDAGKDDDQAEAEAEAFEDIAESLTARSGESMVSEEMARHIVTRVTDEGLIVEIFDVPGTPLFQDGSDEPTQMMRDLAAMMAPVFGLVLNEVAVGGHTRAEPVVLAENPVWDLSSSRASRVRRLLQDGGLPERRIQRVSGFADRKPVAANPMAVRNNRIEMILLRQNG